ncbi:unnamed protein product [Rotaria sordida]|uniref:Sulfotransferase n=1 Tax=Rotaria sordida TaxID=392033 RepID=A0A815J2P3_9BILA|nr:unnamed protein product [Rotaria sordida]
MWLHEKFYDAEKLLKYNPNWILYTISNRYAYFTLLPKPITEYNVKNAPFIWLAQFTDALKLARMPIKDFCTFACHSLGPMKGKVIVFTNCPRSGSTLITQMVQVGQQVQTIAEPSPFTNLAMMHCYALPEVTYENLISKPEETIGTVFDVCGISKSLIPKALTALNRDSQAGTVLSRDKMAQVKSLEFSKLDRKRLNEIAKRMELPESIFHF